MVVMWPVVWCKHMAGCPWCGGNFLTNHHLSNFPSPRQEEALRPVTELWRGSFPPKPKPLHIFSKKHHICRVTAQIRAGFRFVCCPALDLFGVAQTVFPWYCGLYLCVLLQSSVIYCPSFLSAVKCCESRWSAVALHHNSHMAWRDVDALWPQPLLMRICELWRDVDFLPISVAMTWR